MNASKIVSGLFIALTIGLTGATVVSIAAPAPALSCLGSVSGNVNFEHMKAAYKEARRYISNARQILRDKAGRENGFYTDRKYVRMAGNTAWNGVLEAVEIWLNSKGIERDKRMRPNVDWYTLHISKHNHKLNSHFISAYEILHKFLGYDGALKASISKDGIEEAEAVIALCEKDT